MGLLGVTGMILAGALPAQTNLITFTNRNHEIISNAVVLRCDGVKLIYRMEGASGGSVKLSDLPRELQERFGYDPAKAVIDEQRERALRRREAIAAANAGTERAGVARFEEIKRTGAIVWGKIIQRTGDKLLIQYRQRISTHGLSKAKPRARDSPICSTLWPAEGMAGWRS